MITGSVCGGITTRQTCRHPEVSPRPIDVASWVRRPSTRWTSYSAEYTDVTNKISATFPIVIGINTQARHESIQIGPRAGLSQSAAVSAASTANTAFVGTMHTSNDYTTAVTSALDSLRTSLAPTDRERGVTRSAPAQSSGWGIVPIVLLVIGVLVVVVLVAAILIGRRRVLGPRPQTHDRH